MRVSVFSSLCVALGAVAFGALPGRACLQMFDEPRPLKLEPLKVPVVQQISQFDNRAMWQMRRADLETRMRQSGDYRLQNDLSVALVHLGELRLAMSYFQSIEQNQPLLPQTADNIGTTYELMGDNAQALRWIREGVKRNAQTLDGSEWIHVRILETKVTQGKPTSVLGLDFGSGDKPIEPQTLPRGADGKPQTLSQIEDALKTQLHERLQFVSAPDAIVASLLFDLGNCLAVRNEREDAADIYQLALRYNPVNRALVAARLNAVQETWNAKFVALMAILFAGLSFGAWRLAAPLLAPRLRELERVLEHQTPSDSWVENSYSERRAERRL